MDNTNKGNNALPEMAMAILNSLSGLNAEFSFDFDNIELQLPNENPAANPDARWKLNGSLRIRTKGNQSQA